MKLVLYNCVQYFSGNLNRSTSELDLNRYNADGQLNDKDDKKKRGRSPFR